MSKPVFNPPERIYLQVVGSDDKVDIEATYDRRFHETMLVANGEITWCVDRQNDSDLEYRLARRRLRREICQKKK